MSNQPPALPTETDRQETESNAPSGMGGLYIGRLLGIPLYLHYSWFLIAAILIWLLSTQFFPAVLEEVTPTGAWIAGTLAAVIFFFSILLHELGHSVVSVRNGIPVPRITLLFIGGIAEISREPDDPKTELKIALGGPAVTFGLVFVYFGIAVLFALLGWALASALFQWLAVVNLGLLIFNAIPGYPLDGGRVLRALIWMNQGDFRKATMVTSRLGVVFSFILMGGGIALLFMGQWQALVLFVVGIFLKGAAESGYAHAIYRDVLRGVSVEETMCRQPIAIPASTPLNLAVDDFFLASHHSAYPVCDDENNFLGLLRLDFLKNCPREKWPYTHAGDLAVKHGGDKMAISPDAAASTALQRMSRPGSGRLAVVRDGQLTGMLTRHDLMQFIQIRTELEDLPNTQ